MSRATKQSLWNDYAILKERLENVHTDWLQFDLTTQQATLLQTIIRDEMQAVLKKLDELEEQEP